MSFLPLDATFSVGQYAELAHAEIDELLAAGRRPIVVGGTGLYLRAALTELDLRPPPPEGVRERWTAELEREGAPALHALLADARRGRRRESTRTTASAWCARWSCSTPVSSSRPRARRSCGATSCATRRCWSGLTMEREALYARIDARVEGCSLPGVEEEVRRAYAAGASETARKALGFEELLAGDVEAMKRRTRNYAQRQLTWMSKLARRAS